MESRGIEPELIAGKLVDELEGMATKTATTPEKEKATDEAASEITDNKEINDGADRTRTRDLQRDRLKFCVPDLA